MITIQNDLIQVGVNEKGAELASIQSVRTGLEYMWEADAQYWGRHSCILFPVIGAVNQGVIRVDGKSYPMSKHGIVRDRDFELIELTETSMTLAVASNEETKVQFPFDWELQVTYEIEGSTCHVNYEVYNEGESDMPFSIGAHPAFNCPIYGDQERSDYKLVFDEAESQVSPLIDESGLISTASKSILDNTNELSLPKDLFDQDALIMQDFKSKEVAFVGPSGKSSLTVRFEDFTHLGIWSKNQQSPFVCIEPWFGIADPSGFEGEFKDKPGVVTIEAEEAFSCRHSITVKA